MRTTLIILALSVFAGARGQDLATIGNVSPNEMSIKECPFDKDATALVLLDEAKSDYNDQHNLITVHHIKIKILKEKGLSYANVEIPFYSRDAFEFIDGISGITINQQADGQAQLVPIENKSIFTEKTTPIWSTVKFTFPSVKVGSIVEYVYRSTKKHYGGLDGWTFQWEIPVVLSSYDLVILPGAEFAYQIYKRPDFPVDVKPNSDAGSIHFAMHDIPALTDEPFMDARINYEQRVKFQLSGYSGYGGSKEKYNTTWPELARDQMSDDEFGGQLNKNLEGTSDFIKQVKLIGSPVEKLQKVYDYVRDHMSWDGHNRIHSEGIKSAWNKRTGSSADINLALVNLLRSVDLDADPLLVSERDHGRVSTSYPFLDQFNTVYAVVSAGNKNYYLDATNKYLPWNVTPYEILNTTAFIVNKKNSQLVNITDEEFKYNEHIVITGSLTNDGVLNGNAHVRSTDYARVIKVRRYLRDRERFINEYFKNGIEGISIDSFKTTGEEIDTVPFLQNFNFKLPLSVTGDYRFLDLNLFTGERTNPFLLTNRFSTINFGYKSRILLSSAIDIPDAFIIDAMPKEVKMTTADHSISFQRSVSFIGGKLIEGILIETNKSLFEAEDYPTIKEFYKKMYDALNETIVLKKK